MVSYFESGIRQLYDAGILDILLPFILIFTVIFAILQRTKVLGQNDSGKPMKNFNAVVALVMGAAAVIPHILWGSRNPRDPYLSNGLIDVVQVINNALPNVSLIVIAVLAFLILIGIWGVNINIAGSSLGGIITIVSLLVIIFIFTVAAGIFVRLPNWLHFLKDPQTQALVVTILVFGLIIRFIVGGDDEPKNDGPGFFDNVGKTLSEAK